MRVECPELTRCCFCLPLRKGLLIFGYFKLMICAVAITQYSFAIQSSRRYAMLMYQGSWTFVVATDICIVIYVIEAVFTCLLIFGLHKEVSTRYIKWYFYYGLSTTLASVAIQAVETFSAEYLGVEFITLLLCGVIIQVYLLILIKSFLKKINNPVERGFDNQFHQAVEKREKESYGEEPFGVTV